MEDNHNDYKTAVPALIPPANNGPSPDRFLISSGMALTILFAVPYAIPDYANAVTPFLAVYLTAFTIWGYAVWRILTLSDTTSSRTTWIIIGFAILFRVLVLPQDSILDDDLYRYIWDGRIWLNGINPYSFEPSNHALFEYRDAAIHPHINFPYVPTIYPPMAQYVFALSVALAGDSLLGMKLMFTLFDIATIAATIGLLKSAGLDPAKVIIYAWCPLVIKEVSGSGHMDTLVVLLIVISVWQIKSRPYLSAISLGAAVAAKLYPVILVPLLIRQLRWRTAIVPLVVVLAYAPFLSEPPEKIFKGFLTYGQHWLFNPGVFDILRKALALIMDNGVMAAKIISAISVVGFVIFRAVGQRETIQGISASVMWTLALMLILAPAVNTWYLICLLPFLCVLPSPALLFWMALSFLSYTFYYNNADIAWFRALEYTALFGVLFGEMILKRKSKMISPKAELS